MPEPATETSAGAAASKVDKAKKKEEKPKPHDGGWRETIESLAMAVILALLFKGYVAEAFVIPTGSMAPTLQGRHKDVSCPQCGHWYQATASDEVDQRRGAPTGLHVVSGTCPVCRYTQTFDPIGKPNDGSFSGDRIIVSKFAYEIAEPERWDVIVFKYPFESTQNYIKRLVGLPGEHLTIIGGNVYVRDSSAPAGSEVIARKPPHKLTAMLQLVDDTDYIPPALTKLGWPSRWRESPAESSPAWKTVDGGKSFACETAATSLRWLRYRHLAPEYDDWELITLENRLPPDVHERRGHLISDLYAYNTSVTLTNTEDGPLAPGGTYPSYSGNHSVHPDNVPDRLLSSRGNEIRYDPDLAGPGIPCEDQNLGNHWVDDLAVECLAEIQDTQGTIALDLVRAGIHYRCTIDVATGQATLSRTNSIGKELSFADEQGRDVPTPQATTIVQGAGFYRLRLTNCDHQVMLFVNGKAVTFNQPTFYTSPRVVAPQWTAQDALDLEPAGIGISGARAKLSHLRIYRDKYYIAINRSREGVLTDYASLPVGLDRERRPIQDYFSLPEEWNASRLFDPENRPVAEFEIGADMFFPMGDNSPGSYDGRYWLPEDYVHRDLLIGKALLIYWPHSWNRPPLLPHFQRMGRIR